MKSTFDPRDWIDDEPNTPAEAPVPSPNGLNGHSGHQLTGDPTERHRDRALKKAADAIAGAADGQKHAALNTAAYLLGGYVAGGVVSEADARDTLRRAIDAKPNVADIKAAYRTIDDGLRDGAKEPITSADAEADFHRWREQQQGGTNNSVGSVGGNSARSDKKPWGEPAPIRHTLPPVPPLERDMLPEALRDWVFDTAGRMPAAPDYAAVPAVLVCAALIGNRVGIYPKRYDDWLAVPNLYGVSIGDPSRKKSPPAGEMLRALKRLVKAALERHAADAKAYGAEYEAYDLELKGVQSSLTAAAKKGGDVDGIKGALAALKEREPEEPTPTRYRVNDCTVEKLADLLVSNPAGLLWDRDELMGLFRALDKPGREQDRAFLLEAWGGNGSYSVDRIARGSTYIERVTLTIFGTTQPDKLEGYLRAARDGDNDGLLQRFQLMVYPDPVEWQHVDRAPDHGAKDRAYKVIEALAALDPAAVGARPGEFQEIPALRFDAAAQAEYDDWTRELHTEKLTAADLSPLMCEHLSKYPSLLPSLALIFHLIDEAARPPGTPAAGVVSVSATRQARRWCDYLEAHARRVYDGIGDTAGRAAEALAANVKKGKLPDGFTGRDVQRKGWRHLKDRSDIDAAVGVLIERGWLRESTKTEEQTRPGRPESESYEINPVFLKTR